MTRVLITAATVVMVAMAPLANSVAQPAKALGVSKPVGESSFTVTCPITLPATASVPKGFTRTDGMPGLMNDSMFIPDEAVYCSYGSLTLRFSGHACKRESGPWDPNTGACMVPPRGISLGQCVARCKP